MMAFGLLLLFAGYLLMYAGIKDVPPWGEVIAAIGREG